MKKLLILVLTIILGITSFAFHMTPDGFGKRFDNDEGYQEFTFKNDTGKTIRYRFEVLPGRVEGKSMHEWVDFEPKNLTIRDGESKKMKLFAKAPEGTPVGDYSFYLAVNSVTVPGAVENKENAVTTGTTIGINMNVEMLGWVGDLPANLKLDSYEFYEKDGKLRFKGVVNNRTEKRFVRYMIELTGNKGQKAVLLGGVLSAMKTREFDVELPQFTKKSEVWKIEVMESLDRNLLQSIKP